MTLSTLADRTPLAPWLPFMDKMRQRALVKSGCEPTISIPSIAGLGPDPRKGGTTLLKWCRHCAELEQQEHELPYWHSAHQRSGCWICRKHGVVLNYKQLKGKCPPWTLPTGGGTSPVVSVADQLLLLRVDEVITWICSSAALDPAILQALLRYRLWRGGYLRSELKALSVELVHLDLMVTKRYGTIGLPDLLFINRKPWVSSLILDRRDHSPLQWAMALAWTADSSPQQLQADYRSMMNRKPQRDLFNQLARTRRRAIAPQPLYDAFCTAENREMARRLSGWEMRDIDAWLRKDPGLGAYWRKQVLSRKWKEAIAEVVTFQKENHGASRTDVLRGCSVAYRFLQAHDPKGLESLLPAAKTSPTFQHSFDF